MKPIRLQGHYINLDRSTDRKEGIEKELRRHGLEKLFRRFSAVEPDTGAGKLTRGELGCLLSHRSIIAAARHDAYTIILEDDCLFPESFGSYWRPALQKAFESSWDMMFLTQSINLEFVPIVNDLLKRKQRAGDIHSPDFQKFTTIDAKRYYSSKCVGYIISPSAIEKLVAIFDEAEAAGYQLPVDILFCMAIRSGRLSARFLFPYIIGVNPAYRSTMVSRAMTKLRQGVDDSVNLFVAGLDPTPLRSDAAALLTDDNFDSDAFVVSQILYRQLSF